MSPSIWTECAGDSEIRPLSVTARRAVEAQHVVSTARLVDTLEEQAALERMLERVKPAPLDALPARALHYLLAAPFRYPPLRHGSRFSTRSERSVLYGSVALNTCLREVAYYRFLFLEGTTAALERIAVDLTIFRFRARTRRGIDLTRGRFAAIRSRIAAPDRYDETQQLGRDLRAASVQIARYPSARDPAQGTNVAVFSPSALQSSVPEDPETWHCITTRLAVELLRRDPLERRRARFERNSFLVNGALPHPAP
jgi:hypothetical protein